MKFIISSFGSLVFGLLAGYIYMFLQVKTAQWFNKTKNDAELVPPPVYRSLLAIRILITVTLLIIAIKTLTPNIEWLVTGFLVSVISYIALIIKGISWN